MGVIAGCNGGPTKWPEHFLANRTRCGFTNCTGQFLHLEFQEGTRKEMGYRGRRTVHGHAITWVDDQKPAGIRRVAS